jgi:tetratricopeptide (TPR) repeat protein
MLAWFKKHVIVGIIGATLVATLTAWLSGFIDTLFRGTIPSSIETACIVRETVRDFWPFGRPTDTPDKFRVLIARLDADDAEGTQTYRVTRVFLGQHGVAPIPTCRVLRVDIGGEPLAVEWGRDWLRRQRADLLIWGRVVEKDKTIDLWFISNTAEPDYSTAQPFRLEKSALQEDFKEATAAQLLAVALAAIKPATDDSGRYLVETLQPIAARLKHLIEQPPPGGFSPSQLDDLNHALGDALSTLGAQSGDNGQLVESIAAYRKALVLRIPERVPLDWAMTQNNLGFALFRLGEHESVTAHLDQAVAAYGEALKERTRERAPLDWAMTQNNLGNALFRLGEREYGTARLEKAVAAFRDALKEYTRERAPLGWAMTQSNLGNALVRLGERENDAARIEEAVAAYRDALKEYTREREPLNWATTQNNLGNVLRTLGARESGTARLDEAVAAYREALKESRRERVPLQWAMTQNNLALALLTLGARESGTARLDEAVAAYDAALQERTHERDQLQWARSTGYQGIALKFIAERRGNLLTAERALAQITAAFETFRKADAPDAIYYEGQLPAARALVERLRKG